MTTMDVNEESLFAEALAIQDPHARAVFLDQACAGHPEVRRNVESLLAAYGAGEFLEAPAPDPTISAEKPTHSEGPGTVIGPYKLLQAIGEGGMGRVYMAEQLEPVQRKVALKIIKPGMDSRAVLARFAAERQALALMEHPNIARVFEAGTTASGRPYFVMELVKGVPITRYCDEHHLTPRQRLELFVPVCQAVQHAHQKGVIHRDLKPSNVLVAEYDEQPVAKVIDFGVAKAIGQKLTERTLFTEFGQVVGTLEYMSPEQAKLNALDIDTRSDIYALGVLLYELLTGSTPFERQRLRKAAFDEVLRIIREEEPPKPSTRLSSTEELPTIAANRGLEPRRLSGVVRGELDWIVMKCLEKDRARRYDTANALARDIERYLHDEPVEACPPTAWYRARKLLRRNRGPVAAAAGVVLTLVAGVAVSSWLAVRAYRAETVAGQQRDEAEAEKRTAQAVREFLQNDLLKQADARAQAERLWQLGGSGFDVQENPTIKELLNRAALGLTAERIEEKFPNQPVVQAEILHTVGAAYYGVGDYDRAISHLRRADELLQTHLGEDHPSSLGNQSYLADAYRNAGKPAEAIALFHRLRDATIARVGPDHPDTLSVLNNLALATWHAGNLPETVALLSTVRDACLAKLGPSAPQTLATWNNLAEATRQAGKTSEAIAEFEKIRDASLATHGPDHPTTLFMFKHLALAYRDAGKPSQALRMLENVRATQVKNFGPDHPSTLDTLESLAETYRLAGKPAEAVSLYQQVRDGRARALGPEHPATLSGLTSLAAAYWSAGKLDQSVPVFEEALSKERKVLGVDHLTTLVTAINLAVNYRDASRLPDAIRVIDEWLPRIRGRLGATDSTTQFALETAASLREASGAFAQAMELRAELLTVLQKQLPADDARIGAVLAQQGLTLLKMDRPADAEPVLRASLAIRAKTAPDDWRTFNTKSLLGGSLLGQKKYNEAEPLLLAGYEGMRQREGMIPVQGKPRLSEARERLLRLYEATGQKTKAEALRNQK
jgi:serine/threonine protein kinase